MGVVPDVPDAVAAVAKGPVEREIIPIVTPGTVTKEALLEARMPPRPRARP